MTAQAVSKCWTRRRQSVFPTGMVGGFVTCAGGVSFIRGDCNDDGLVNLADGIYLINAMFLGGPALHCDAACDANGDGLLDSSDAIYIWNYRFLDGPPPPAPFPACGASIEQLTCGLFESCP